MNLLKKFSLVILSMLIYYFLFNEIDTSNYLQLNTYYSLENNNIILGNAIFFNTIVAMFLSNIFNHINNNLRMKNYILIRTEKINGVIIKSVFKLAFLFTIIKLIIDIIIFGASDFRIYLGVNMNLFLFIIINSFIYIILLTLLNKENLAFVLIVCFNLIISISYVNIPILKAFALIPFDVLTNFNENILKRAALVIIFSSYIILTKKISKRI